MAEGKGRFTRLFYLFLTGCIVGWIYEVVLGFIYGHGFVNRGFLFGPYLPLYGFGLIILYLLLGGLMRNSIRIKGFKINPILVFLGIVLITTVLEYLVGYAMLEIFGRRWWDYSNYWMNYQGFISFNTSIRFGIGGMFLLYALVPLTNKIVNRLSTRTQKTVMIIIIAAMVIDLVITLQYS